MNPHSLGPVNKHLTEEVLRKRKAEPNLSDSEYSSDNSSRSKRKYGGNLFIFIFLFYSLLCFDFLPIISTT